MVSYYNSLGSMFPGAPSAPAPPSRTQGSNSTPPGATYFNPYAPGANYHPQSANHHSGAFAPGNPYVPQQFTGQTPSDMYFGFENAGSTGHWGQHHPSANAGLNTLPTTEASSTAPASSSSWFGPETWAPPPSPPTCQQQASFDQSASSESPVYSSGSSYQFGSAPPPTPPPAATEDSPPDVSLPASSLSPPPSSAAPSSAAGGRPQPARSPFQWMKKPPGSSGVLPGIGGGPGGPEKSGKGRTRTKDKYRVVYTDHQRLELEKEFHYSRYITIRRKAELANNVGLSERQVKIWFQNRRAKERRSIKKSDDPKESGKLSPDSLVGSYPDIPQIPQHHQLPGSALHPMAFNSGAHLPGGPQPHFPPLKYE